MKKRRLNGQRTFYTILWSGAQRTVRYIHPVNGSACTFEGPFGGPFSNSDDAIQAFDRETSGTIAYISNSEFDCVIREIGKATWQLQLWNNASQGGKPVV